MTKPPYIVFETVEDWNQCIRGWIDDAQRDVLSWLECEQHPWTWIRDDDTRSYFHLWCLGHNLAIAGALAHSAQRGPSE